MSQAEIDFVDVPIPLLVIADDQLSLAAKGLYTILAKYQGKNGCWPAQLQLCLDANNISQDSIARLLKELKVRGWIDIRSRRDHRGLVIGKRYILLAHQRMFAAKSRRSEFFTDSAPVRSPDSAPVRSPDSAPVRSHTVSLSLDRTTNPLTPSAAAPGEQGNLGLGPLAAVAAKPRRMTAREEQAQQAAVGHFCGICSVILRPSDVGAMHVWRESRRTWQGGYKAGNSVTKQVILGAVHDACRNNDPAWSPEVTESRAKEASSLASLYVASGMSALDRPAAAEIKPELADIWTKTLSDLRGCTRRSVVESWFEKMHVQAIEGDNVVLFCPDAHFRDYVSTNHVGIISASLAAVLRRSVCPSFVSGLAVADCPADDSQDPGGSKGVRS